MSKKFDIDKTIEKRAQQALEMLLSRGKSKALPKGYRDHSQAHKFAQAARSWCSLNPAIGAVSNTLHSRRRGGATHRMWLRVSELCAQIV